MDSGQPCNCGHCSGCDHEGYLRNQYNSMMNRAYQVAHNDKLFEKERIKVLEELSSDRVKYEHDHHITSNITEHMGDIFFNACAIRREEEFYKKYGRQQTILEFLNDTFPNSNKE